MTSSDDRGSATEISEQGFRRLSLDAAQMLMHARSPTVLDIRDEASFAAGRIEGARAFDGAAAADFVATHHKEAPVIVCCYHGHSSQQAAAWLTAQGFTEVYSLDGGFTGWSARFPGNVETPD